MKTTVRAGEIEALLEKAPDDLETLSLDCFDTLVWRNVNMPVDVFHELGLPGAGLRVAAEARARKALALQKRRNDITIADIYAEMESAADEAGIARRIDAELEAEKRHCFAFAPVARLIEAAKARGLTVVIVSDTYLREPELRSLIEAAAGEEIAAKIDRIFCSCEYGEPKAGGLFRHVLAELGVSPGRMLHLGDNAIADQQAPAQLGIHSAHFEQFDDEANERLRLEAVAATLIEPDARRTAPALQPHRAQISLRDETDPARRFGHDVLGPLMYGFANWIAGEADAIEAETGKPPKLLFLLRDGFLPAKAFTAARPDRAADSAMIELSRFTANAASFVDRKAIETYLLAEAAGKRKDAYSQRRQAAYCKQLLFTTKEANRLSRIASPQAFMREILKPANIQKITGRAREYGERLFAHLRAAGVEDGDCVMFVDLGYNGSVQNAVAPVLAERMRLDIRGRYLLLRELALSGADKKGMIDSRHYDFAALHALCESIAVVEQLATIAQGSVVGYADNGDPVRDEAGVKGAQSEIRDAAQAGCVAFVERSGSGWVKPPASWDGDCARRMAAATLARLLFLPVESEVEMFASFDHDVNMGTGDLVKLIDPAAASDGLKRRGLFYTKNVSRMYLPGELKQQGVATLLSLFAGRRFGLDLRQSDFQGDRLTLPVVLMDANDHVEVEIEAHATNEGFYQALVPVGAGRFTAGLMVGRLCEWLQVEDASFHPVDGFMEKKIDDDAIPAEPIFEGLTSEADGLYRAAGEDGFVVVPPPLSKAKTPIMLSFVFRPVVRRDAARSPNIRKVA